MRAGKTAPSCSAWFVCCSRALLIVMISSGIARAQDDDEGVPYLPGLVAIYSDAQSHEIRRVDLRPQLIASVGTSPSRDLSGSVRWIGFLMSEAPGDYHLHAHAWGHVRMKVNGELVLDSSSSTASWHTSRAIPLSFAWHPFEIEFIGDTHNARFSLFWSGPNFDLEPLDARHLFHDEGQQEEASYYDRGEFLSRALRCDHCHHQGDKKVESPPAPSLAKASGQLYRSWIVGWLQESPTVPNPDADTATDSSIAHRLARRRMPYYRFTAEQAAALAAYITGGHEPATTREDAKNEALVAEGRDLFLTVGCLACHGYATFGDAGMFGGGDLSVIAAKRPPAFFRHWLEHPEQLNARHRMPVFPLSAKERHRLSAFLSTLGSPEPTPLPADARLMERGRDLFEKEGCAHCHEPPEGTPPRSGAPERSRPLSSTSSWDRACSAAGPRRTGQPWYYLSPADQRALQEYYGRRDHVWASQWAQDRLQLAQRNCSACHARGQEEGLAGRLASVLEAFPELSPHIAAMSPPSLNSVGDKLNDQALAQAVRREGPPRRPWLQVRMPYFVMADDEWNDLIDAVVRADRIPEQAPWRRSAPRGEVPVSVGARLVTPDGFGCTSCHAVGKVRAPNAPVNTLGPDLLLMEKRIRREWFDRWVRNPARIVPRMEMPSIQTPVRGVLDDNLDAQLDAVWTVLNQPDFRPPEPNPVRVVRRSGLPDARERAVVLTDVVHAESQAYIQPVLMALPNRHNVLLDLDQGQLAQWWIGDAARQRVKGKSWYWESAGPDLLRHGMSGPDIELVRKNRRLAPLRQGQFVASFDEIGHAGGGVTVRYRLVFAERDDEPFSIGVVQSFSPWGDQRQGFVRELTVDGLPDETSLALRLFTSQNSPARVHPDARVATFDAQGHVRVEVRDPDTRLTAQGELIAKSRGGRVHVALRYVTDQIVDTFPDLPTHAAPQPADEMQVVPGFEARRLPLPDEFMPTSLAWDARGNLIVGSLKGRVWRVTDEDHDGFPETATPISDELAAPYGLATGPDYIDVLCKYALLRLYDDDGDGRMDRMRRVASGWGHTEDYHDWAVGLPSDGAGGYYIGLPCQQDERSAAAAALRGTVCHLIPRSPSEDDPCLFAVEPVSRGHRFPMGLARNRHGELFVTDNQGNFNPFNELNHVRPGAHFGFINALDRKGNQERPPLTPPAINIPHPWTRSVNGICFLEGTSPHEADAVQFGPFTGHVLGCEYDTRRLIRMSLQRVGDTIQGAAYPFSIDFPETGPTFLGPLAIAVAPDGDVYVGSIRDSGWGGANNIGEIVRLRPQWETLPTGIAEVQATKQGFVIAFTQPVDASRATDLRSYVVSSYRRISTPDYGGPDVDRRTERLRRVALLEGARAVRLEFESLRAGFVYEFHLRNLNAESTKAFFPSDAYYTLHVIPGDEEPPR